MLICYMLQMLKALSLEERVNIVQEDLKAALEGLALFLFGEVEMRWVPEYFPFTDPSLELEIMFRVSLFLVRSFNNRERREKKG